MNAIADLLRRSPPAYASLSIVDTFFITVGCALFAFLLFRCVPRKRAWPYIVCAALNAAFCIAEPLNAGSDAEAFLWATLGLILPYVSMLLIFWGKGVWKSLLAPLGYAFIEALRFFALMIFFRFDYTNRDDAMELPVGIVIDLVFFGVAFFLFLRRNERRSMYLNVTKNGALLFLMIVLSTSVLVSTVLVIGSSYSDAKQVEFGLMLLNIPVLTATVTFALMRWSRMRTEAENYKKQLDMQIRQFEWMEQMVEDVRVFRHDFPKKLRPLIAYLDEDKPDEAKKIAEEFTGFTAATGEKYHTGNYRLDTVLFCEQQLAQREGVRIDVPFDTAFPKEGIDPDDIYTIFPNALDNAIEACRKAEGEKVITLRTRMDRQTVFITIRNPVSGEVRQRDGLPQTTKEDKNRHGYGFKSIKKAAARYGSDNVSFTVEDGVFELRIFLQYAPPGGKQT